MKNNYSQLPMYDRNLIYRYRNEGWSFKNSSDQPARSRAKWPETRWVQQVMTPQAPSVRRGLAGGAERSS